IIVPESVAVPASQAMTTAELATHFRTATVPGLSVPAGFLPPSLSRASRPLRSVALPAWAGQPGELGPEDIVIGLPGLPAVVAQIKQMAAGAGIPDEQTGYLIGKYVNEDQAIVVMLYGGKEMVLAFPLARPGFTSDIVGYVTVKFDLRGIAPTGQQIRIADSDYYQGDTNPTYDHSSPQSHGWT